MGNFQNHFTGEVYGDEKDSEEVILKKILVLT